MVSVLMVENFELKKLVEMVSSKDEKMSAEEKPNLFLRTLSLSSTLMLCEQQQETLKRHSSVTEESLGSN